MDLGGRSVALYGRFSPGLREAFQRSVVQGGGSVARDLTSRSAVLVVGALASALVDSGALPARLEIARRQGAPVLSERGFARAIAAETADLAAAPLETALATTGLGRADADVLAAFDLIVVAEDRCRFGDQRVLRTASELLGHGLSLGEAVRILVQARDLAPAGRHQVVLTPAGEAALQWENGRTTLAGQGVLPLDEAHASVDELFEAAALAEADGDLDEAARLYDTCTRADRTDAIAPYNYGNIRLTQGDKEHAALAYQRALARDAGFVEARYNLAQALEAQGKPDAAASELGRLLCDDPGHADAVFNLAQLKMKAGQLGEAKALYERYLALDPPKEWAATARKAISYCSARLSA